MRLNLRAGSLAALGVVGILLPAAAGIWLVNRFDDALTERIEDGQLASARSISSEVHQSLDFSLDFTRAAAHRPGLVSWTRDHNSASLVRVLTNIFDTTPLYSRIAVFDAAGRLVGRVPGTGEPPPRGNIAELLSSAEPRGEDAFVVAREPVSDPNGPTVGTLVAEISLVKLFPGVTAFRNGRSGRASLVDASGRVLVTGEPDRVGTTVAAKPLLDLARNQTADTLRYFSPSLDRHEIAALAPAPDQGWSVFVTQAESEAFSSLGALRRVVFLGLVALLGTAGVIAVAVSRAMGRYEQRLQARLREQQRLNEALDQFAGKVAHDLRNPLSAVKVASGILAKDREQLGDSGKLGLEIVERQSERMLSLVEGLLRLARASGTPQPEPLDLKDIVEDAARDIEGLRVHIGRVPDSLIADRTTFSQAIGNLLQNAARYGRANGEAAVDVEGDESDEGWIISISDRGPGVPTDEAGELFQPFRRGSASRDKPGSGLGLAIVAAAVTAHGGRASYAPRVGGGSTFSLFLPAVRSA